MKKPENVENDKSKVELSQELTDAELDAVAGGAGDDPSPKLRVKLTGPFNFKIVAPVDLPKLP